MTTHSTQSGSLAPCLAFCTLQDRTQEQRARRQQLAGVAAAARIRRGMIRYVQLVLDLSRAAGRGVWLYGAGGAG